MNSIIDRLMSTNMNCIIDFVTFTKGIEYIIAVIFLFGFIAFWKLLSTPKS